MSHSGYSNVNLVLVVRHFTNLCESRACTSNEIRACFTLITEKMKQNLRII